MVEKFLRRPARSLPPELEEARARIEAIARGHGLDFFETIFEMCDYDEINMLAAYAGFPTRYPHWRWGMEYLQMAKGYEYGLQKIYEMVINTNPSYAYLLDNNTLMDQKLVMAHVFGHVDFFKNNIWFGPTNRKMLDVMANHASKVRRIMDGVGVAEVEAWLDVCLSVDNLIDPYLHMIRRTPRADSPQDEGPRNFKLPAKGYMDSYINPPEYLEAQKKRALEEARREARFPDRPVRDVLGFILEHGRMQPWQAEILEIVREEAYYFVPQGQTKIMNEGWACVLGSTYVFTEQGIIPMRKLVAGEASMVSDGERQRRVYDQHIIRDHAVIRVKTRRGLSLCGSNNHRIRLADRQTWKRLDALAAGDRVEISGGAELWAAQPAEIPWTPSRKRRLDTLAAEAGVSTRTLYRHQRGGRVERSEAAHQVQAAWASQADEGTRRRKTIRVPTRMTTDLAAFLGYLVGDGHISTKKRVLGLTTGDLPQAVAFADLASALFGLKARERQDQKRWRIDLYSLDLQDFLIDGLGLTAGKSAWYKAIPDAVLQSPAEMVFSFLRALFDCDGYAGRQGIILSSRSDTLSEQCQLLLLNAGILSRRRLQPDGCWHLHIAGQSAARFAERIGFGLLRKQQALSAYLADHQHFKAEVWEDEVVSIEAGTEDVYDISVEETHRYAAGGFINHNSFWHTRLMTTEILEDSEVIDYADHHSGTVAMRPGQLNPYKIGIELWRDIEFRWNTGKFGKDWAECDDYSAKRAWHIETNQGKEKIFAVRKTHNDVTFIDEFLTEDVCRRIGLFTYGYDKKSGEYIVDSREFKEIKKKLLFMLSNHGQPRILVSDANHANRGELELIHEYEETDLQVQWASTVLGNLARLWGRPVHLKTKIEGKDAMLHHTGEQFTYDGPKITGKK